MGHFNSWQLYFSFENRKLMLCFIDHS
jgi:hypothetical protein